MSSFSPSVAVARSLFRITSNGRTGLFRIESAGATFRLELEQGFLHAIGNVPRRNSDEESISQVLDRLSPDAASSFEERSPNAPKFGHRISPFHPARLLRAYLEKALAAGRVDPLADLDADPELRLRLTLVPHPSCLSSDEKIIVDLLSAPRSIRELSPISPPSRLRSFLRFLEAADALTVEDFVLLAAYEALGLAPEAGLEDVKRAYHRLARDLHPDRHPTALADERRQLEARFHTIAAAYSRILAKPS